MAEKRKASSENAFAKMGFSPIKRHGSLFRVRAFPFGLSKAWGNLFPPLFFTPSVPERMSPVVG
jgi:hypothetical protein